MTDIVERLRRGDPCGDCKRDRCACVIMEDAADEITRLRAKNEWFSDYAKRAAMDVLLCKDGNILLHEENERLRAALLPFASIKADHGGDFSGLPDAVIIRIEASVRELKAARAALEER